MALTRPGGRVVLASVVEQPVSFPESLVEADGIRWLVDQNVADRQAELEELAERAPDDVTAEPIAIAASTVTGTLLRLLDDENADCIAVGRSGAGGLRRALLGGRSQQLLEHAACPVLIVHEPGDDEMPAGGRVVIAGVDGSDSTQRVVSLAAQAARRLDAELLLVHVVDLPVAGAVALKTTSALAGLARGRAEQLLADAITDAGLNPRQVETLVLEGDAGPELVDLADERAAALVVVGDRGRQGFRGLLLGSAARKVVVESERPVLVVKHCNDRAAKQ